MNTRGVRNRNPGNIDFNPRNDWQGQLGVEEGVTKPRFARFDSAEIGIRALAKLLMNYRGKDGMPSVGEKGTDTVLETINRWAPASENDTKSYANAVARPLGIKSGDVIDIKNPKVLRETVLGIIIHENGGNPYSDAIIDEGVRRALA